MFSKEVNEEIEKEIIEFDKKEDEILMENIVKLREKKKGKIQIIENLMVYFEFIS